MIRRGLLALLLPFAGPLMAEGITLHMPVDCVPGQDCYIQQYLDQDPGPGARDYRCGGQSYDGHSGTDFALRNREQMAAGVAVQSAAGGVVLNVRDGMPDTGFSPDTAADVKGRECGNGVRIDHGAGWIAQYCHLRQGSVAVRPGDTVTPGSLLGQIGQSGRAAFPHLHFTLRHKDKLVDPFNADANTDCNAPARALWATQIPYRAAGVINIGLADHVPSYAQVKQGLGSPRSLPVTAPKLVFYGHVYGVQAKDTLRLTLTGPKGEIVSKDINFSAPKAQSYRAIGRNLRGKWQTGAYTGTLSLIRDGALLVSETRLVILR